VEGFDALGARICAIVACGDELGAPERDLVIEDGLVANKKLDWFSFGIEVELWVVLAWPVQESWGKRRRTSDPAPTGSSRSAWLKTSPSPRTKASLKISFATSKSAPTRSAGTRPSNWSWQVWAAAKEDANHVAASHITGAIVAGTRMMVTNRDREKVEQIIDQRIYFHFSGIRARSVRGLYTSHRHASYNHTLPKPTGSMLEYSGHPFMQGLVFGIQLDTWRQSLCYAASRRRLNGLVPTPDPGFQTMRVRPWAISPPHSRCRTPAGTQNLAIPSP
jgi:hypothetical protein